tara:strand:- start:717 stop:1553 length:837 start_codon:yes stop_codon:yes gene_type:complete
MPKFHKSRKNQQLQELLIHDALVIISTHADLMKTEGYSTYEINEAIINELSMPWSDEAGSSFSGWVGDQWSDLKTSVKDIDWKGVAGQIAPSVMMAFKERFVVWMLSVVPYEVVPKGLMRHWMEQILIQMSWEEFLVIYKDWNGEGCNTFASLVIEAAAKAAIVDPVYNAIVQSINDMTKGWSIFTPEDFTALVGKDAVHKMILSSKEYEQGRQKIADHICAWEIPEFNAGDILKSTIAKFTPDETEDVSAPSAPASLDISRSSAPSADQSLASLLDL